MKSIGGLKRDSNTYKLINSLKEMELGFAQEENYYTKVTDLFIGEELIFYDDAIFHNKGIILNEIQQRGYDNLKLSIELIPSNCSKSNVRTYLKESQWKKLGFEVFEAANNVCEICGEIGTHHPLECHEVWHYDENSYTQILSKFMALCPICHKVKHIGHAMRLGPDTQMYAIEKFQNVNNLPDELVMLFIAYSKQIWCERSEHQWNLDISLVEKYEISVAKTKFESSERKIPETMYVKPNPATKRAIDEVKKGKTKKHKSTAELIEVLKAKKSTPNGIESE